MGMQVVANPLGAMTATVEEIRRTAEARLQELAPLLDEALQLHELLAALDAREAETREFEALGEDPSAPLHSLHVHAARGEGGRAPHGSNKRLILGIVAGRPGTAAPEIAMLTGLKRAVVASTISRLKRTGELEACGSGVRLPAKHLARTAA